MTRTTVLRLIVAASIIFGVNYLAWRWFASLNWEAWWISVPLVVAETYSLIDTFLFGLTVWKAQTRALPPAPTDGATVDVMITTYNEPIELVMTTACAAQAITFPHTTWILDDGSRPAMREAAERAGLGYITRGEEWNGQPHHSKAGNVNNALMQTNGEFLLILDADQIPRPRILDRTLGYFTDAEVALVQTPQVFSNVATGDPLGSQAPLFYGPIQQGKDGWNAAFFCGSNAILRREALMQLGIVGYVKEVDRTMNSSLRSATRVIQRSRSHPAAKNPFMSAMLDEVAAAVQDAQTQVKLGIPFGEITYDLHRRVDAASQSIVALDVSSLERDLLDIRHLASVAGPGVLAKDYQFDAAATKVSLGRRDLSPLNALEAVQGALLSIAIDRPNEAQPVMPLATISVTEDMATSMRLHGLGWKSVYHHEVLADGLAPEDAGTMLTQRLRWGQGTMQVFLRENPLLQRTLTIPQRLMYFSTMWSYLSGFAAIAYFAAPIIFLTFGILPVTTNAFDFFIRFIPFFVINQLLFVVAARGLPTWRGQQYSLALFPVWIKSCTTAFSNVVLGVPLSFAVTPKTRPITNGPQWHLIKHQIFIMVLLVLAMIIGCVRLFVSGAEPIGTVVNIVWAVYDLVVFSVLFGAVTFQGFSKKDMV